MLTQSDRVEVLALVIELRGKQIMLESYVATRRYLEDELMRLVERAKEVGKGLADKAFAGPQLIATAKELGAVQALFATAEKGAKPYAEAAQCLLKEAGDLIDKIAETVGQRDG